MRVLGNDQVLIKEGVWNGSGTGAGALFIILDGRFNIVEAELSLPGLMLLVHQQTTHLLKSVRRGKLSDSNRFLNTLDHRFYIFRDPCEIALFDSHFFKKRKNAMYFLRVYMTKSPRRPPVIQALSGSLVAVFATLLSPIGVFTPTFSFAALSIVFSAGCTRCTVLALLLVP